MKKFLLVEPCLALYSFAVILTYILVQQYVYQRLWKEMNNATVHESDNSSLCNQNTSDPSYIKQQEVQKRTSLFYMYLELTGLIPSLVVTLIIVAYSDHRGRKITILLPLLGALLTSVIYFCVSYFSLDLNAFFAVYLINGFLGGLATFLGGCFAYVADLCNDPKQKNMRMALVDMIFGLLGGIASLTSGYFVNAVGFSWPFLIASLLHFINIIYVIFFLEETVHVEESQQMASSLEYIKDLFSGVFLMFKTSAFNKRLLIILMLIAFMTYNFANVGGASLFTLYELNTPLCWNTVLIGYGSALSTLVFVTSFLGVALLSHFMRNIYIVLIGMCSSIGGLICTAFAKTTLVMFLVRLPSLLSIMPLPVLRSMMSRIVLPSEQGALFACVACLESLSTTVSLAVFNSIYASTVLWFSGFSFILAAAICLIPFCIIW
ncbi:solute carrier family 46 member 3 [Protopterus annectens]|uniref:solute carrier family 46 member 3 n=1 Tax=Protopterus annectens TaxID=7888 RepID=UPI001CFBF44A|nr:solute carrier family 46 member 3 [Protopterus annectens]